MMTYVLLINKDRAARLRVAAALSSDRLAIEAAESPEAAICLMQQELPGAIVWDWPTFGISPEIFVAVLRQEGFSGPLIICAHSTDLNGIPYDILIRKPVALDSLVKTVLDQLAEDADSAGPNDTGRSSNGS
jgi:DNA-binding NtrC family response regulator